MEEDREFRVTQMNLICPAECGPEGDKIELYTPRKIIDPARELMGRIDLDPCSCPLANETVQATHFLTSDDDGLSMPWLGRVWLNPPYCGQQGAWVRHFDREWRRGNILHGLCLVPASTEAEWFQPLWDLLCPILFLRGRQKFNGPSSDHHAQFGSALAYVGTDRDNFRRLFRHLGTIR